MLDVRDAGESGDKSPHSKGRSEYWCKRKLGIRAAGESGDKSPHSKERSVY